MQLLYSHPNWLCLILDARVSNFMFFMNIVILVSLRSFMKTFPKIFFELQEDFIWIVIAILNAFYVIYIVVYNLDRFESMCTTPFILQIKTAFNLQVDEEKVKVVKGVNPSTLVFFACALASEIFSRIYISLSKRIKKLFRQRNQQGQNQNIQISPTTAADHDKNDQTRDTAIIMELNPMSLVYSSRSAYSTESPTSTPTSIYSSDSEIMSPSLQEPGTSSDLPNVASALHKSELVQCVSDKSLNPGRSNGGQSDVPVLTNGRTINHFLGNENLSEDIFAKAKPFTMLSSRKQDFDIIKVANQTDVERQISSHIIQVQPYDTKNKIHTIPSPESPVVEVYNSTRVRSSQEIPKSIPNPRAEVVDNTDSSERNQGTQDVSQENQDHSTNDVGLDFVGFYLLLIMIAIMLFIRILATLNLKGVGMTEYLKN